MSYLDAGPLEDLNTNRITRILTTDFPQYFAIITRIRQELHYIGPEGGLVNSSVVPQVLHILLALPENLNFLFKSQQTQFRNHPHPNFFMQIGQVMTGNSSLYI